MSTPSQRPQRPPSSTPYDITKETSAEQKPTKRNKTMLFGIPIIVIVAIIIMTFAFIKLSKPSDINVVAQNKTNEIKVANGFIPTCLPTPTPTPTPTQTLQPTPVAVPPTQIVAKPEIQDNLMENATKQLYKDNISTYMQNHYGLDTYTLKPKAVVLHYTGTPDGSTEGIINTFDQDSSDASNANGEASPPPAAHFIIDQDGTIHQIMPTNLVVRHALGVNDDAIGIEFVEENDASNVLDRKAQLDAGVALVRWLMYENNIPKENILGHGTVNDSLLFNDQIRENDHTDWNASQVEQFNVLLGNIPTKTAPQPTPTVTATPKPKITQKPTPLPDPNEGKICVPLTKR